MKFREKKEAEETVADSRRRNEHPNQEKENDNKLMTDKLAFVTLIVEVICLAQTESRTEKTRIILGVAEKYLNVEGITILQINEKLKMHATNPQVHNGIFKLAVECKKFNIKWTRIHKMNRQF